MTSPAKQSLLETWEQECATTMRVLRAYPAEKAALRPHPDLKTARELAWTFVMECGLGTRVWNDEFKDGVKMQTPPPPPEAWEELLQAVDRAQEGFRALIRDTSDDQLREEVHFFTAPKTMGAMTRMQWAWFLLHDQIHHRGQFSVYTRLAGGRLPSIYGPTKDEPWI